jgi:hypothetical protein
MRTCRQWLVGVLLSSLGAGAAGCSEDVATGQRCEDNQQGCTQPQGGTGGKDGGAAAGGGAGGASGWGGGGEGGALGPQVDLEVQDAEGMRIESLTLACEGDCADLVAVARGGNPPYTFVWEDGSTDATRHVCLEANTTLRVAATDTGFMDPEFRYDAQTATSEVTVAVLGCGMPGVDLPRDQRERGRQHPHPRAAPLAAQEQLPRGRHAFGPQAEGVTRPG